MAVKTIGICTGGGDCPGLNAVIRAVVKSSILKYGWRVIGFEDSFDGLIWPEKRRELGLKDVSGLLGRGGTMLGTTNRGNPFCYKVARDGAEGIRDFSPDILRNARDLGLHALVVVGGDGTLKIALKLQRLGLNLVGVPKTIDNDIGATEYTFGFNTAVDTATHAIDRIHTSAEAHHRVMLAQVMGQDAGWIALEAGLASGAHVILVPEIPFTIEKIADCIRRRKGEGKRFTTIVVAEGVKLPPALERQLEADAGNFSRPWKVAAWIGDAVARETGQELRTTVLGHVQRGGPPTPFDRLLATRFGVAATDLVAREEFGRMVCLQQGSVRSVAIADAVSAMKCVEPDGEMVQAAKAIGVCFGD